MPSPVSRLLTCGAALAVVALVGCARKPSPPRPEPVVAPVSECTPALERKIGEGHTLGNLTVYPITSCAQADPGPIVTLDDALANGAAVIRELEGGGSVNTLAIENRGKVPLFVLAGTIVKGGKQDRQIGQDYLIGALDKATVDAFCVEHGRWNENRDGKETGGVFRVADVIATSKVRAAGQYEKNQGKVWAKVAETNAANDKAPPSDTLLASIDDATLARERDALAERLGRALANQPGRSSMVGFAYAIDGEIKGARWFGHHRVYSMHEKKLLRSVALDAALVKAEAKAKGTGEAGKSAPTPAAVEAFLSSVEQQAVKEERDTSAANVNAYKESPKAYGSKMMMKPGTKASASATGTTKALSVDVTSK